MLVNSWVTMSYEDSSHVTQERLYKILETLQSLARDIPAKFQQRLPYDLLSSLAHILLDSTVFEIVRELADLQHMTEKSLHDQRTEMVTRHKNERNSLQKKQKDEVQKAECQGKSHVLSRLPRLHQEQVAEMEARQTSELTDLHLLIQRMLDQKVKEQQTVLQQVGVPGFYETANPTEIKVQMYIMEFIVRIGGIKVPP